MTDNNLTNKPIDDYQSEDFFRKIDIQILIHELKGPLDIIETSTRMLLEFQNTYGRLTVLQQKALKRSMRCSAKLRGIIHSLLEVGSSQAGHICLQFFDAVQCTTALLVDILETEFLKFAEDAAGSADRSIDYLAANGIFLDISPEVQGIVLRQDATKYGHILSNLVRNAMQHKKSKVIIQLAVKEPNLQIRVCDDGPGIDPKEQMTLFNGYTQVNSCHGQTRRKGHGLGLSTSRILARCLGGDIMIDNPCRIGTTFLLRLPLVIDEIKVKSKGLVVCCTDKDEPL